MRRICCLLITSLLGVGLLLPSAAVADPPPPPIVVSPTGPQGGNVGITVGTPGEPGDSGQAGGTAGNGDSGSGDAGSVSDPECTNTDATGTGCDPCRATAPQSPFCDAYQLSLFCSQQAAEPGQDAAQFAVYLQSIGCTAAPAGPTPPTADQLAAQAYGLLSLPAPVPGRYPSGTLPDGRPYTIVNTLMWFWTDPSTWTAYTKTVCAGELCATATARPSTLSLDPGNRDSSVVCPGPGTAWVRSAGAPWAPSAQPQGCDYRYVTSTYGDPHGELTATYTTTWTVTWTGTNGTAGTLNPLTTATTSTFAVAELQSVATS